MILRKVRKKEVCVTLGCCCAFWELHRTSSVLADEPQFLVQPQSMVVAPQGEVTLRCEPRDSATQILWVFNGEFISSSARDGLEITHGRLHIRSFRHRRSDGRNQAGVYQCIARNSVGAVISKEAVVQQACEYSVMCNALSNALSTPYLVRT